MRLETFEDGPFSSGCVRGSRFVQQSSKRTLSPSLLRDAGVGGVCGKPRHAGLEARMPRRNTRARVDVRARRGIGAAHGSGTERRGRGRRRPSRKGGTPQEPGPRGAGRRCGPGDKLWGWRCLVGGRRRRDAAPILPSAGAGCDAAQDDAGSLAIQGAA